MIYTLCIETGTQLTNDNAQLDVLTFGLLSWYSVRSEPQVTRFCIFSVLLLFNKALDIMFREKWKAEFLYTTGLPRLEIIRQGKYPDLAKVP